ncbi:MAG: hypothetical protein HQM03_18655 [Magnetococcales bacterium]|nr:hypothetical protein [Magnetococcales bacterium]
MPMLSDTHSLSDPRTTRGLHAQALLEANEERISALHNTLRLLEQERNDLCGRMQKPSSLTPNELLWIFRPPVPLTVVHSGGNYC